MSNGSVEDNDEHLYFSLKNQILNHSTDKKEDSRTSIDTVQ